VAAMASDYHRPTRIPPGMFEGFVGGDDPATLSRVAHDTATAILSRVRENPDPVIVQRLVPSMFRVTGSMAPVRLEAFSRLRLTALLASAGLSVERRYDGFAGHRVALAARRNGTG